MKTKTTKKVKKVADTPYNATAIIMGKKYVGKGKTVAEAIGKIDAGNVKGKCVLVIEKGDYRKERILQPIPAYRLFNSMGMTREVALKNISILF